jgi:hypothetical protein
MVLNLVESRDGGFVYMTDRGRILMRKRRWLSRDWVLVVVGAILASLLTIGILYLVNRASVPDNQSQETIQ